MENPKEGNYWATHIETGQRWIIEVLEGDVYIMGNDRTYRFEEFSNYVPIPKEA